MPQTDSEPSAVGLLDAHAAALAGDGGGDQPAPPTPAPPAPQAGGAVDLLNGYVAKQQAAAQAPREAITPDTPVDRPMTTGERAKAIAGGYLGVPKAIMDEGRAAAIQGVIGLGHRVGLVGDDVAREANEDAARYRRDSAAATASAPGAGTAANIGGQVMAASAAGPAGAVPMFAALAEGQGYEGALEEGATPQQAALSGDLQGLTAGLLPGIGRVAGRAIAPVVGRIANPIAQRAVAGAAQGTAAGAALGASQAVGTAAYDPQLALQRAKDIPAQALLLGALGGVHGGVEGRGMAADQAAADANARQTALQAEAARSQAEIPAEDPQAKANALADTMQAHDAAVDQQQRAEGAADLARMQDEAKGVQAQRQAIDQNIAEGIADQSQRADQEASGVLRDLEARDAQQAAEAQRIAEPAQQRAQQLQEEESTPPVDQQAIDDAKAIQDAQDLQDHQWRQNFIQRMAQGRAEAQAAREADAAKDEQWRQHVAQQLRQARTGEIEKDQVANPYAPPEPDPAAATDEAKARLQAVQSEEDTNAPGNHPQVRGRVRQAGEGRVLRDREEAAPRPRDVPEAKPEAPKPVAEAPRAPEPAVAPEAAPAAPPEHMPGDRVRMDFKGQGVEGRIVGRAPEGRFRVQADDGRSFPAVAPERITSLEERRAGPPAVREAAEARPQAAPAPRESAAGAEPRPEPAPRAARAGREPESPPRMTGDDLRRQLDSLPVNRRTPGLTDALMKLTEARAKSAGLSLDEYVGRKIAGVRSEADRAALNQKDTLDQRLEVPSARLKHQYLLDQWKKAHGDRSPTPTDKDWLKLKRQADMVDEAQGRHFFQGDRNPEIDDLLLKATSDKTTHAVHEYRAVDAAEAERLKQATGRDFTGYQHSIDTDAMRHALKEHADPDAETKRGQVPITDDDFHRIPDIVAHPDSVVAGKGKSGAPSLTYLKRENGTTYVVEEAQTGNKRLAFRTMWKRKAGASASATADGVPPQTSETFPGTSERSVPPQGTPGKPGEGELQQGDRLNEAVRGESLKRGAVQFLQDGRAIIHAFQHADESTVLHELAHVFRRDLSGEDLAAIEDWAKVKDGNWTRRAEEQFARGFERYARDGQAPTPQLKGVFQQFFGWLHNVYRSVTGSAINVDVSPAAKRVFDRLLTDDGVAKNVPREIPELPREEAPTPKPSTDTQAPPLRGPGSDRTQNSRAAEAPTGARPEASTKPTPNARPDLATPGETPEARAQYVEERNAQPDIAARSRADIRTAAEKRVAADPEGTLKKLMGKARRGDAFNAEDMGAAQHLLDRLASDPKRASDFRALSRAYHLAGNEGAVAMGMRVDRIQTPEGRASEGRSLLALPKPVISRRIEQLRQLLQKDGDALSFLEQRDPAALKLRNRMKRYQAALDAIEAKDAKRQAGEKAHMKRLGFDIDQPDPEWAKDPDRFTQFVAALDATKGGMPAVARELYIGAAHMSGTVFGKKILADAFNVPATFVRRHIAAAVGEAKRAVGLGTPNEDSFRELGHMWSAVAPAFAKARANAVETLFSEQHPKELMGPEDVPFYPAMRGVTGTVLRHLSLLPTVRAIDTFTRSLVAHIEVAGQAYRSGAHLPDDELAKHMEREVGDFHSESWGKAREEAMRATFTERPIAPVRALNRLKYQQARGVYRKAVKFGANVLEPFSTIPSNIATQGLSDWTPGLSDVITVAKALRRGEDGEWHYDGAKFNRDVAQAILRWGSAATFATAAANGYITGAADERNPDSINAFGHHFSYKFLGPIGRAIGAAADVFSPSQGKKPDPAAMRVLKGSWDRFGEMPVIRLGQDAIRMITQEHDHKDGVLRFLADHVAGFMEPSIVHQAINAQSDEVRAKASFAKKNPPPAYQRFAAYLKDRMTSNSGKPVVVGGKPLVKDSFDSPIGTLAWRIFSPLSLGNQDADGSPNR